MAKYEIYYENMPRLERKLQTISRKCEKYGCSFRYRINGDIWKDCATEIEKAYGIVRMRKFTEIETTGTAIINDWQFVATVEHTESGNLIKGYADGVEVPEKYYTADPVCDHCGTNRVRKYTYIIRNTKSGEFKQVGKSCLKDYTHGLSAELIAQYISAFDHLINFQEPSTEPTEDRYILTSDILPIAAETVRIFGYVKRNSDIPGKCTADRVRDYYNYFHGKFHGKLETEIEKELASVDFEAKRAENYERIKSVLEWINNFNSNCNNYMHNLKLICGMEYIGYSDIGILVSAFPAYAREMEKQRKREAEKSAESGSSYIGELKERITVPVKSFNAITSYFTDFGETTIYKIVDTANNVLIWKTSTSPKTENITSVTGTVKAHKEYKGTKQTELTRCKVA